MMSILGEDVVILGTAEESKMVAIGMYACTLHMV